MEMPAAVGRMLGWMGVMVALFAGRIIGF